MFLYQLSFNNPATPIAEGIMDLHHSIFFFLILILGPVLWMFCSQLLVPVLWRFLISNPTYKYFTQLMHGTAIDIIWTITPALILMLIAVPSFSLFAQSESEPVIEIDKLKNNQSELGQKVDVGLQIQDQKGESFFTKHKTQILYGVGAIAIVIAGVIIFVLFSKTDTVLVIESLTPTIDPKATRIPTNDRYTA
jgi:heme/copper-type cytochrome/quinol oxidase subunit 2